MRTAGCPDVVLYAASLLISRTQFERCCELRTEAVVGDDVPRTQLIAGVDVPRTQLLVRTAYTPRVRSYWSELRIEAVAGLAP